MGGGILTEPSKLNQATRQNQANSTTTISPAVFYWTSTQKLNKTNRRDPNQIQGQIKEPPEEKYLTDAYQTRVVFNKKEDEKKNDLRYFPTMSKIVKDKLQEVQDMI